MSENKVQIFKDSPMGDFIVETREHAGELTIEVKAEAIVEVCKALKNMGFTYLSDITGIDWFTDEKRFGIAYNLMNLEQKSRLRIACRIEGENPEIDTVCEVWKAATWFEREVIDMLGIQFKGHPDPRRIYMPEDFEYYPLRKEFPLIGIPGSIQLPEKDPHKEYK